jgi:hypothetical protein
MGLFRQAALDQCSRRPSKLRRRKLPTQPSSRLQSGITSIPFHRRHHAFEAIVYAVPHKSLLSLKAPSYLLKSNRTRRFLHLVDYENQLHPLFSRIRGRVCAPSKSPDFCRISKARHPPFHDVSDPVLIPTRSERTRRVDPESPSQVLQLIGRSVCGLQEFIFSLSMTSLARWPCSMSDP